MLNAERPRLRHCTIVADPEKSYITLVVGKDHFNLEQSDGSREDFFSLKSLLDGHHSIGEISDLTTISLDDVRELVNSFRESGLLQNRTEMLSVTKTEFLETVESSSIMWRRQIGLHKLFGMLEEGVCRREVFLGLLLETYHYVRLLAPTLLDVVKIWDDNVYKQVVLEYANEEINHYLAYEAALERDPRLHGRIRNSHPTVGTVSLIRNFESIGRRNPLSLVCSLQLIEARPFEADQAEAHLQRIARKYAAETLISPFIAHMRADLGMEHSNLLASALSYINEISATDAHEAVNDMHDIKHCFDEFHDGVLKYYGDISNYIPRPKVDFFAL